MAPSRPRARPGKHRTSPTGWWPNSSHLIPASCSSTSTTPCRSTRASSDGYCRRKSPPISVSTINTTRTTKARRGSRCSGCPRRRSKRHHRRRTSSIRAAPASGGVGTASGSRPHDYGCRGNRAAAKLGLAGRGGHAAGTMIMTEQGETGEAITILLVEDDAPTCWRLQDALVKAGYEVRTAGSLGEARSALASGAPRVLLTDLRLPDGHGVELIRETRRRFPDTEIMVISALGDEESVISAITVGATGYLLKDAFPTDIATTVCDLVAGHSPISASIARFIVRRTQSSAEIASHLGLSRQTVPGHIKNIYRKLEVHTRGEAVFEAVQQGLIKL